AVIGPGGIVVEGRDIGTTVAPDAPVKIFLTAHPAARAARRGAELGATATDPSTVAATEQDLLRRDTADRGRAVSPLAQANNAIVVDSTDLDADAVIARVLDEVRAVAPA
ncbi:MAG: CMP/dCMP kinase, partial [Frankiaceae bacterium]|nr:CMP/dCMP kinase [Frankiaceae bacterium]